MTDRGDTPYPGQWVLVDHPACPYERAVVALVEKEGFVRVNGDQGICRVPVGAVRPAVAPSCVTLTAFGREVTMEVANQTDGYGQFLVAVKVDGKKRWDAHFTDKS